MAAFWATPSRLFWSTPGSIAVVCAALDLLTDATGSEARAARVWAFSGILGAAFGPAAGGFLTQLLGWESIFVVQAPVMLVALVVLRGARAARVREPAGRPNIAEIGRASCRERVSDTV